MRPQTGEAMISYDIAFAEGAILGSFLVVLGFVWCHFWSFWGVFGVSGGVLSSLGRSWEGPGGRHAQDVLLGSIFEAPWGPQADFYIALGAQEGAKTEPKYDQKASLKSMQKTIAC